MFHSMVENPDMVAKSSPRQVEMLSPPVSEAVKDVDAHHSAVQKNREMGVQQVYL